MPCQQRGRLPGRGHRAGHRHRGTGAVRADRQAATGELICPPSVIGSNTVQSIQSGLLFGYVGLVEGMVVRFKAELDHRPM